MINNDGKIKYSIGLSLDISLEQYREFFDEYRDVIHSVYFSPPLGYQFHSRRQIAKQFEKKMNDGCFLEILNIIRENGILLDAVLNTYDLSRDDIIQFLRFCARVNVDEITTLSEYLPFIPEGFPCKLNFSFNNGTKSKEAFESLSPRFESVVIGNPFLRDVSFLKRLLSDRSLIILVNNGCSYNCMSCRMGAEKCKDVLEDNLRKSTPNDLYAKQSFFPNELNRLVEAIDSPDKVVVKISNRTSGYLYLKACLQSYIDNIDPSSIHTKSLNFFHLWCRLGAFIPYYGELDIDKIIKIKEDLIWHE